MTLKGAAQEIRDTVTMDQILGLYGYTPRHGFIVCPFHGDKDASLKVYKGTGGWHCFGCGKGGSMIDFVMAHEGCDFRTAVEAIDHALGLRLRDPRENPFEAERQERIQEWLDDFVGAIYAYLDAVKQMIEAEQIRDFHRMQKLEEQRKTDVQGISTDDWTFLLTWQDEDEYNNYRIEKIGELKKEVAAWRRKRRRVMSR